MSRIYRFNITLRELERAIEYSRRNATNKHHTVTLIFEEGDGIGTGISVALDHRDTDIQDITDLDAW